MNLLCLMIYKLFDIDDLWCFADQNYGVTVRPVKL